MKLPPRWAHQTRAVDWSLSRPASYLHLPMGAGKSRAVIDVFDQAGAELVLIVAPKAVVGSVWPAQFTTWSSREWHVAARVHGTIARRVGAAQSVLGAARAAQAPAAVVINYAALLSTSFMTWAMRVPWDVIVFDEIHSLKSPRGKTSKAAARLRRKCPRVIGLSGTPMPHSPLDIWAQLRTLSPDVLGRSFVAFRAQYAVMGGYQGKEVLSFRNLTQLADRISDVVFSPPAKEVELNLPRSTDIVRHVTLSPKATKLYRALHDKLCATIDEGTITYSNGLVRLLRMSQLTGGLAVVEKDPPSMYLLDHAEVMRRLNATKDTAHEQIEVCDAKEEALREILDETGQPVVVFGQFTHDLVTAERAAGEENYLELSGHRNELGQWQRGERRVLGVQISTGAMGISLVRANICVYLSTGYNMGQYDQSRARLLRPGQERPVMYYHLHAKGTVDELIYRVLAERGDLVKGVLRLITNPTPTTHA